MADRDPKTGLFLPGNKMPKKRSLPPGLRSKLRSNRVEMFEQITRFANMTLSEVQEISRNAGSLTNIEAMALKFWAELRDNPSTALYSMLFSIHGWDLNSIKEMINKDGSVDAADGTIRVEFVKPKKELPEPEEK